MNGRYLGMWILAALLVCVAMGAGERAAWAEPMTIEGDSLVLAKTDPGNLCFGNVEPGSLEVRSTFEKGRPETVVYTEGQDYTVDYTKGSVARTTTSRIPDFSTNILFGQKDFDHNKFPGFGNVTFTVYASYKTSSGKPFLTPVDQSALLERSRKKLEAGGPFTLIGFGDSIMFGGDASREDLQFLHRYGAYLAQKYPQAQITVENGATGGDSTVSGLQRIEEKVLTRKADLVLVGFGMNDHNIGGPAPEVFENNLVNITDQIRARTGADVIIVSTFPPNPDWHYGSHRMELFAAATQRAAEREKAPFADLYTAWTALLDRKDMSSMLGNNINHPNDFGHWLYTQVLISVGL